MPGVFGQAGLDHGHRAAQLQGSNRAIDLGQHRAAHLGDPPERDPLENFELTQAQVGMDHADRNRQVGVGLGLDERDVVVVPVDHHIAFQRQIL